MAYLINEMFDTDLDDMMACYQTSCSSLGLPTPKALSRMTREREQILASTRTSSLQT